MAEKGEGKLKNHERNQEGLQAYTHICQQTWVQKTNTVLPTSLHYHIQYIYLFLYLAINTILQIL